MVEVLENSPSLVLRASHILLVRVVHAQVGDWRKSDAASVERDAKITLTLDEALKGAARERSGERFEAKVKQYGTGVSRIAAVPGVWSMAPLNAGTRYVAFACGRASAAADLVSDPICVRLIGADECLDDVRLALDLESRNAATGQVLDRAAASSAALGYVFGEYLNARVGAATSLDEADFDRLLALLESSQMPDVARITMLDAAASNLIASADAVPGRARRFGVTLFRLLGNPKAAGVHGDIVDIHLPNLLGIVGGRPARMTPAAVFERFAAERAKASAALSAYQGPGAKAEIEAWLKG